MLHTNGFIPYQETETMFAIVTNYAQANTGNIFSSANTTPNGANTFQMAISLEKVIPAYTFTSFGKMENFYIDHLLQNSHTIESIDDGANISININRAISNVAKSSRRGRGSILLMNSKTEITKMQPIVYRLNPIILVTNEAVPDNNIICLYIGSHQYDSGSFFNLMVLDDRASYGLYYQNSEKYATVVKIKENENG